MTLQATIKPPAIGDDPTDHYAHKTGGFRMLIDLFRPFDDTLVGLWNKTRAGCQQHYLAALDKQYREVAQSFMGTDPHFGDAAKNQQWLKNLVWQIGAANDNASGVSYNFPMEVPNDVLSMATSFNAHGVVAGSVSLVRYYSL